MLTEDAKYLLPMLEDNLMLLLEYHKIAQEKLKQPPRLKDMTLFLFDGYQVEMDIIIWHAIYHMVILCQSLILINQHICIASL